MHWLVIVSHEGEWEHNGDNVDKEMLYRRDVETRKGKRRGKGVMKLVVASIESGMVEDAMDVVCQDLARYVAEDEMSHHFLELRQTGRNDKDWAEAAKVTKADLKSNVGEVNEDAVADTANNLSSGRLSARIRLMLVGLGELGEANINEMIYGCREPEPYELDEDGDDQFDLPRRIILKKLIPPGRE